MSILGLISGMKGGVPYQDETVVAADGINIASFEVRSDDTVITGIAGNMSDALRLRVEGKTLYAGDLIFFDGSMTDFVLSGRIIGHNG